ncbi:hypothetical protein BC835DRAFT_1295422, partial [Cytidiella melzeri]
LADHLFYLAKMEAVHMSADESGGEGAQHPPVYHYTPPAWQSEQLRLFFEELDQQYREHWLRPSGRRRSAGNPPRVRVRSAKDADFEAVAPRGLPRCFYNQEWVVRLKPWQVSDLDIDDVDFDLAMHAMDAA